MIVQQTLTMTTRGRGVVEITADVAGVVARAPFKTALCNIFLQHTSASLIVCENADPQVLRDLEAFMARLAPDGDRLFRHTAEGPDDMPAHVRSVLTHTSLSLPVHDGRLLLGTWQGVFLYEHRRNGHGRRLVVTVHGE